VQPQIRYAKTPDGVSIAYYAIGSGPAVVYLPPTPFTHVELEWNVPELREAMQALASAVTLVRYDSRGFGMSSRDNVAFSLAAAESDLDTVLSALGLELCSLVATGFEAMTAIAYAAHHPERVTALILNVPQVRGADVFGSRYDTIMNLARTDWPACVELFASTVGRGSWLAGTDFMGLAERATTQDMVLRLLEAVRGFDASDLLGQVTAPTLVIGRRALSFLPPEYFGNVAAEMPNASHQTLEGSSVSLVEEDVKAAFLTFVASLAPPRHSAQRSTTVSTSASTFRTILFTDLVDHTNMMQRLGDAAGRVVLREHERITREALSAHGGTEVKTDGDSFMASFASVSSAVECAVALQRTFSQHNETTSEPIVVRMGLNVGEPIEEEGDYFGSAVILGARIKDHAKGGEILVPEAVRHMLSGKNFAFADRGEFALKGFENAVRLYEVRWRE
jgi:class 3 adenylate cyclase